MQCKDAIQAKKCPLRGRVEGIKQELNRSKTSCGKVERGLTGL
jgi:hypothetical protein